jgi:NADH/NAD ratio-sensing transcriptional regulator Rex
MSKEFLASRAIEIPVLSTQARTSGSDAITRLRAEVKRMREFQPVEIPVPNNSDNDIPVDPLPSDDSGT